MDAINALFELGGAFAIIPSIVAAHRAKRIAGVSIFTSLFFTSWGWWNIFYYPSLDQTLSACAAVLLAATNSIWLGQIWIYRRRS